MRKLILLVCTLIAGASVKAQDPHFSQFFASPLTLNPAFTGKFDGIFRLAVNYRDQWPSIPKAYVTTSGSIDAGLLKGRLPKGDVLGVGFSGLSDKSADGALKLNYGTLSLSYHKALDEEGYNTLGAGFQGTYSNTSIDKNKLTFEDQLTELGFTNSSQDPFMLNGASSQSYFDMNAGLLFSGSSDGENNYYIGASVYHINRPYVAFNDKNWILLPRISFHGGGALPLNEKFVLHGSFIHQIQNEATETVLGAALQTYFDEAQSGSLYIGSWYRTGDALIPYMGLEIGSLRFGASYDVNVSNLKAATQSRGGAEFSIIYIKRPAEPDGSVPCPKF